MCMSDCDVNIEYEWMYVIIEYYLYMNVNRLVDIAKCIYIAITHILSLHVGFAYLH